jgi:hypothetical protein
LQLQSAWPIHIRQVLSRHAPLDASGVLGQNQTWQLLIRDAQVSYASCLGMASQFIFRKTIIQLKASNPI